MDFSDTLRQIDCADQNDTYEKEFRAYVRTYSDLENRMAELDLGSIARPRDSFQRKLAVLTALARPSVMRIR